ncbi:MAG: UDP-glucose 4-epimerase GalE [Clostridiales bacterium GWF2_38_85]|nr:MAG: UDP-glucose 4-epimerase GalE [Clostridiales bacterium GWF2_38_85]HBL84295.1 UDP-glucose 4-epimerase GalE [Clostridiales bacterium]
MNILVTGATGYIGSHVVISLLRSGNNVIGLDNLCNSNIDVVSKIKQITKLDFNFYNIDITDITKLKAIFENSKIDIVMHFAALKSVPESVEEPLSYYKNNIIGIINLLECMKDYNIKKIIFSSSATVYDENSSIPYSEENPLNAINPYGRTKLISEQIITDYSRANKDMKAIIFRYFNPIGADSSGLLADSPKGQIHNIMINICSTALKRLPSLDIYGDDYDTPDGSCVRDYVHISDIADGHIQAMELIDNINETKIYNLGSGKPISVFELLKEFEKATSIPIPYVIKPRRPGDVAISYADIHRAKRELKWKPRKTINDMCLDSYISYKNNYFKTI